LPAPVITLALKFSMLTPWHRAGCVWIFGGHAVSVLRMRRLAATASSNASSVVSSATPSGRELDRDHDGLISLEEGVPAYGAPAVSLEPFPAPTGDTFEYSHTLHVPAGLALDRAVVVVHGMDVAGKYDETIPVACGAVDLSAPAVGSSTSGAGSGGSGSSYGSP
jgi:hypothetical protein